MATAIPFDPTNPASVAAYLNAKKKALTGVSDDITELDSNQSDLDRALAVYAAELEIDYNGERQGLVDEWTKLAPLARLAGASASTAPPAPPVRLAAAGFFPPAPPVPPVQPAQPVPPVLPVPPRRNPPTLPQRRIGARVSWVGLVLGAIIGLVLSLIFGGTVVHLVAPHSGAWHTVASILWYVVVIGGGTWIAERICYKLGLK